MKFELINSISICPKGGEIFCKPFVRGHFSLDIPVGYMIRKKRFKVKKEREINS
jgi:hypothetical protein